MLMGSNNSNDSYGDTIDRKYSTLSPGSEQRNGQAPTRPRSDTADSIELYGGGFCLFVGTVGNILSIIVLCRKKLRYSVGAFYFAVLSAADLFVTVFSLAGSSFTHQVSGMELTVQSEAYCKLWWYLTVGTSSYSHYVLAGVSLQRCCLIVSPFYFRPILRKKSAKVYLTVLLIIHAVFFSHEFFVMGITERGDSRSCIFIQGSGIAGYFNTYAHYWLDLTVRILAPTFVIIMTNGILGGVMLVRWLRSLKTGNNVNGLQVWRSRSNVEPASRLYVMLITVSVTFCLLIAPLNVLWILDRIFPRSQQYGLAQGAGRGIAWAVARFCGNLNHAINFFLYILTGKEFRKELLDMMSCRKKVLISLQPASPYVIRTEAIVVSTV